VRDVILQATTQTKKYIPNISQDGLKSESESESVLFPCGR